MDILNQKKRKQSLSVMDYKRAVALGLMDGVAHITKFGRTTVIQTDGEQILAHDFLYGMPSTAELVTVASTSVEDSVGGLGAQEYALLGIDEDDKLAIDIFDSDSVSNVKFKRVFRASVTKSNTVAEVGANGNLGNVTFTQQTSLVDMVAIPANMGQTQCTAMTVPKGYTALVHYADTVSGEGKASNNILKTRNYAEPLAPFLNKGQRDNYQNQVGRKLEFASEVPEMHDILFTTQTGASGASVSGVFVIELIENNKGGL